MGNVKKAFVAQSIDGGVVFAGPAGVLELPDDAYAALPAPWLALDHGTCAEDGLSLSYTRNSKKIKDFDGATYITVQEEFTDGLKAKFLDVDNINLVRSVYGTDNVEVEEATGTHGEKITIYHAPEQLPFQQLVAKVRSGTKRKMYVAELARVSEIAEVKDVYNDATYYEITWDVFRGEDGKFLKEYRDDGVLATPVSVTKVFTIDSGVTEYTATVDGQTTATISAKTAAALRSALEALSNVGVGKVTVTGSSGGPLTAVFTVPVTTVTATGTGGTVGVA